MGAIKTSRNIERARYRLEKLDGVEKSRDDFRRVISFETKIARVLIYLPGELWLRANYNAYY